MPAPRFTVARLGPHDLATLKAMLRLFGEVFDEPATYQGAVPDDAYLGRLLASDAFIAVAALADGQVVGALAAYVLPKFEQPRSEVYIYDLAVAASQRRRGVASAMIESLRGVATGLGAWVVFVQADEGDAPAIALYERFGRREQVLHFDIPLPARGRR